jgi:hypothetical protein
VGGSGTNLCSGIYMGYQILTGTGHHTLTNTRKYMVVLSDGDNRYSGAVSYMAGSGSNSTPPAYGDTSPPSSCQPSTNKSSSENSNNCGSESGFTSEHALNVDTYNLATTYKAAGAEVYVVAFGVCSSDSTTCDTSKISVSTYNDSTADQNLLKCIASSKSGTNDHYYYAATASALPSVFTAIAQQIAHRLIE